MMRRSGMDDGKVRRASTIPRRRKSPCDAVLVVWTMMSEEKLSRRLTRSRSVHAMVALPPIMLVGVAEATACPTRSALARGRNGTRSCGKARRHASVSSVLRATHGNRITRRRRQESSRNDTRTVAGPMLKMR